SAQLAVARGAVLSRRSGARLVLDTHRPAAVLDKQRCAVAVEGGAFEQVVANESNRAFADRPQFDAEGLFPQRALEGTVARTHPAGCARVAVHLETQRDRQVVRKPSFSSAFLKQHRRQCSAAFDRVRIEREKLLLMLRNERSGRPTAREY